MLHAGSRAGALRPALHGPGFRTALCSSSATFLKPPSLQQPQGGWAWCHRTPTLPVTAESPRCWGSSGKEPTVPVYRHRLRGLGDPGGRRVARPPGGLRGPRLGSSDVRPGEQSDQGGGDPYLPRQGSGAARCQPPAARLPRRKAPAARPAGPAVLPRWPLLRPPRPAPRRAGHPAPRRRPGERAPREAGGMGEQPSRPQARLPLASPGAARSAGDRGSLGGWLGA